MNKNEKINSDFRKLAKYQIKLINLKGGDVKHEQIYKYKINEYIKNLTSKGIDTKKFIDKIQRGGGWDAASLDEAGRKTRESIALSQKIINDATNRMRINKTKSGDDMTKLREDITACAANAERINAELIQLRSDYTKATLTCDEGMKTLTEFNDALTKQLMEVTDSLDKLTNYNDNENPHSLSAATGAPEEKTQ